jgi:hypothetical protein
LPYLGHYLYTKKTMPLYHTIKIYCSQCRTLLYKYQKGGTGSLSKCFKEKILKDSTNGDLKCPYCKVQFAREAMISGKPAHKIIRGKVFVKK